MAVNLFTNGAGGNTWNTAGNWSLGTVPTASDGHVATFDATSPDCTLGAARSCNNIDFTGYTNTLTMSTSTLTVAGNVTLDTGLIISGTGQMTINATSTITSNGYQWPNDMAFVFSSTTKTISGDLVILGALLTGNNVQTVNGDDLYSNGATVNNPIQGTSKLIFTGGIWQGSNTTGISNDLDIAGNVTITGTVYYRTGTLTYVSGSVTVTSSVLFLSLSCTLDTAGLTFETVTLTNTTNQTYTINSKLSAVNLNLGTLQPTTFAGSAGFEVQNLVVPNIQAATITLVASVIYTITSSFNCFSSRVGSIVLFTSSHGTDKAILTLDNPSACNVLASFTRIDASNGRTIPTFNGTITDCLNIVEFHDLPTSSHAL
jgi:hypothetical protein